MITTIKIDCETKDELLAHLAVINKEISEKFNEDQDDMLHHSDNNCYGHHTLDINNDL